MEAEIKWLASIDTEISLHISRFFPRYKMLDKQVTPVKSIDDFIDIASRYFKYVYAGNC